MIYKAINVFGNQRLCELKYAVETGNGSEGYLNDAFL